MDFVRLGRTNEKVSVVGLGCGGHSKLGMARGATIAQAADIVRRAMDLGVNFIDTALGYGTEEAVGQAIQGRDRSRIFISTKSPVGPGPGFNVSGMVSARELRRNLETSLSRLKTDYVDVLHLHGVPENQYEHCASVLVPEMKRLQTEGKIRFLGITEVYVREPAHPMLLRALPDNHFDIVMVGFNLLHQGARQSVFPLTMKYDVGTLVMFAVRQALNSAENTRKAVAELIAKHEIDAASVNANDPLDFVRAAPGVKSQVEAAYRYCRHEPGAHVILMGTGSAAHLEENVRSILAPPLPAETLARLKTVFGDVTSVTGN